VEQQKLTDEELRELCECGHPRVRHKGNWPNEESFAGRCYECKKDVARGGGTACGMFRADRPF